MEVMNNVENVKTQMRRGVLEYCILSILSKKDSYASSILLIRQKNQGLLTYRWEESPQGPPRKYYQITDKGRQALAEMDSAWQELVETIRLLREK